MPSYRKFLANSTLSSQPFPQSHFATIVITLLDNKFGWMIPGMGRELLVYVIFTVLQMLLSVMVLALTVGIAQATFMVILILSGRKSRRGRHRSEQRQSSNHWQPIAIVGQESSEQDDTEHG